jgi:hypothetical protein
VRTDPLNEMYAVLIPALLMGNVAVLKLPAVGGLVHALTARAFAAALPPGAISFVSGAGRQTLGPIMASGKVDVLGFIGGTSGADALIRAHPAPHRLKVFAQLAAKNLGVVLPDADLDAAAAQCALGATSYNGQRCTAIKLCAGRPTIRRPTACSPSSGRSTPARRGCVVRIAVRVRAPTCRVPVSPPPPLRAGRWCTSRWPMRSWSDWSRAWPACGRGSPGRRA